MISWNASQLQGISDDQVIWESEEVMMNDLFSKRLMFVKNLKEEKFVVNQSIPTKIQNSYNCGLVIFSQCSEYLKQKKKGKIPTGNTTNNDTNLLMKEAKERGYSKEGEMFDAYNLSKLSPLLGISTIVLNKPDLKLILSHLLFQSPLLIPYDASKNNSPGLFKGEKSHWGSIKGFICNKSFEILEKLILHFQLNTEENQSHFSILQDQNYLTAKTNYFRNFIEKLEEKKEKNEKINQESYQKIYNDFYGEISELGCNSKSYPELYLICKQSKSKYQVVWEYDSLIESNKNLERVSKERRNETFVIPDTLENLREKIILMY